MAWIDAMGPALAEQKRRVMAETWGHLAPKKNKAYRGRFVYAVGVFGSDDLNPMPIFCEFSDLESSPWFYDALGDFIEILRGSELDEEGIKHGKPGCVYEWTGTFRNYSWCGKIRQVFDANLPVNS